MRKIDMLIDSAMRKVDYSYSWIEKVIDSCSMLEHAKSANRLINNFEKLYFNNTNTRRLSEKLRNKLFEKFSYDFAEIMNTSFKFEDA